MAQQDFVLIRQLYGAQTLPNPIKLGLHIAFLDDAVFLGERSTLKDLPFQFQLAGDWSDTALDPAKHYIVYMLDVDFKRRADLRCQ